ncbi:MAG: KTSC domain-containing protein [Bacteroidales bacterium]|nr:MAG: KTSC domain-containing protein [Bacteroidales bacterium]
MLLFNERPDKFFAGAKIEVVTHQGKIGKDYSEKVFTGSIVKQLRDTLSYIDTNIIREQVSKISQQAEAIRYFNYPYQAIEEALVNAVYHRSYERDNPVEVQILPDRIEILNFPGPMPPVDKNMLKKERVVAREYRNRKLGGFLKELKLTEGRGTGLPIIYNSLDENGSPPPVFETDDELSYFLSIIKIHPLALQLNAMGDEDEIQNISSLKDIDSYLRSLDDQITTEDKGIIVNALENNEDYLRSTVELRWERFGTHIKNKIDDTYLKVLLHCISPKSREEIFEHIEIYNNSRNFRNYIKPIIDIGWLQLTIPEKPTSKNQEYIIADIAKRLVESKKLETKRTPVSSASIASVGYDPEKQILEIEFLHGAIYQYFDVPKEVYEELMSANSHASYFMYSIKNNYSYLKQ